MTRIHTFIIALLTFIMTGCSVSAIDDSRLQQASFSDISSLKIKVGGSAPNFTLPNGDGKLQNLRSLLAENHVMLMFYRGDWCPYCLNQLESFEAVLPQLAKHNVQLVAISPDPIKTSQNTQRNFGFHYLFLSDVSHDVINTYGVMAQPENGLPHPSIFLINQQGKVVWYYVSENYKERPTGEQMLEVVSRKLAN